MAEVGVEVLATLLFSHCHPTLAFFSYLHMSSVLLEGFLPLVSPAYYTFQRWMSGLERR